MTTVSPAGRVWTIRIPFTGVWLTSNKASSYRYGARDWRNNTHVACMAAKLPKGMLAVRLHGVCWWVGRVAPVIDNGNLRPTFKAIEDGLSLMRVSTRKGKPHTRGGYGLIPDDSDKHLRGTTWEYHRSPNRQSWVDLTITEVVDGQ